MPNITVKHRASVKDFTISIGGLLTSIGDLITPSQTESKTETKLSMICPEGNEKVTQKYHCEEHGDFLPGECAKGRMNDAGEYIPVSTEMVKDTAKSELPPNVLNLHIHPAETVSIVPSGASYVFRPRVDNGFYAVLLKFLDQHPDLVFMGTSNIRDKEKLFVLQRGLNGQLLLTEVVWPQDVKEFESPTVDDNDLAYEMGLKLFPTITEDFDPDAYKPEARSRLAVMLNTIGTAGAAEAMKAASKSAPKAPDILEAMAALLEKAQAKDA